MPDTPKRHHNNRTSKRETQITPFCHVQNQPTIFHNFSVLFNIHILFLKSCVFWKHYKNSIFSKTQLLKNTVSKTHSFTHVKKHLFPKKVSFLVLGNFRWNHYFIVFPGLHCFGPKKFFWPKQIVCTKCTFLSLSDTNSVRQVLQNIHFLIFHMFAWPP